MLCSCRRHLEPHDMSLHIRIGPVRLSSTLYLTVLRFAATTPTILVTVGTFETRRQETSPKATTVPRFATRPTYEFPDSLEALQI